MATAQEKTTPCCATTGANKPSSSASPQSQQQPSQQEQQQRSSVATFIPAIDSPPKPASAKGLSFFFLSQFRFYLFKTGYYYYFLLDLVSVSLVADRMIPINKLVLSKCFSFLGQFISLTSSYKAHFTCSFTCSHMHD